jgi:Ca2+-binding EF-hand superfamily protein
VGNLKTTLMEYNMKRRNGLAAGIGAFALALTCTSIADNALAADAVTVLQKVDTDHDGTIDLNETKVAASRLFDRLDRDNDGTLDARELEGRVSTGDFAAADPDHDGTLDKSEYLAVVEKLFRAADPDNDGTLDSKELDSASGRRLTQLIE